MKTGLLNKRIEILGKQAVTDEYGFDTQADVVVYRCWASIEPARGKVFYEMERKADTEYSKITIRWRPGVTHDMKVKYQDHLDMSMSVGFMKTQKSISKKEIHLP